MPFCDGGGTHIYIYIYIYGFDQNLAAHELLIMVHLKNTDLRLGHGYICCRAIFSSFSIF
jgi:hypothetical protein